MSVDQEIFKMNSSFINTQYRKSKDNERTTEKGQGYTRSIDGDAVETPVET